MPTVYIDNQAYQVEEGKNMLQVVLDNKINLEYFCWHPAMGSVGACRQCAVKIFRGAEDTAGKIGMACMTPAVEGTRISTMDSEAKEFRRFIIEWLMINHPHDCPVCDEGGECHLQDMTAMSGHVYRRYTGKKRTYNNQNLGPFVTHEMNRCIQCYRCVRFYRDFAGGRDFDVFASRNRLYFGRERDGVLESEFSGNLVEVCPTGVFTDKTLSRHYTRKWDLETAPSICAHCGLGCNTIPGSRYGELRRIRARYNSDVNGYFLCDRGRYGYEFVNHESRLRECSFNKHPDSWDDALDQARLMLRVAKGVVGIGSPRASLEANYALQRLVGKESWSTGLSAYEQEGIDTALDILRNGPSRTPSLGDIQNSDSVLILGSDPTNEAPMIDLAVRQAMIKSRLDITRKLKIPDWDAKSVFTALQGTQGQLFIISPFATKLDELSIASERESLPEIARAFHDTYENKNADIASRALESLRNAKKPLIITSISAGPEVLRAAAELAWSLCTHDKNCWLSIIVPEANTTGVGMLDGMSVDTAFAKIESGEADTLIILENDVSRRVHPRQFESLRKAKHVIVIDCIETRTTEIADLVLPVNSCIETNGTFISNEGRAQRFYQVFLPSGEPRHSWEVIRDICNETAWDGYEDLLAELAADRPEFIPALEAAPTGDWRSPSGRKIARETHRATGRTAKNADKTVFEPRPPDDPQTPFAFSMEGEQNPVPGPLEARFWWPGWNSVQAVTKFQTEVNGPLYGGNSGKRLIEPLTNTPHPDQVDRAPAREGLVWVIPRPRIFGSEELSALAPGIQELTPKAEASMNPELAAQIGAIEGAEIEISTEIGSIHLPCLFDASLPVDVITVPMNVGPAAGIVQPIRADLEKSE
jgi:NADH-quinone oxidoreductase subunit G